MTKDVDTSGVCDTNDDRPTAPTTRGYIMDTKEWLGHLLNVIRTIEEDDTLWGSMLTSASSWTDAVHDVYCTPSSRNERLLSRRLFVALLVRATDFSEDVSDTFDLHNYMVLASRLMQYQNPSNKERKCIGRYFWNLKVALLNTLIQADSDSILETVCVDYLTGLRNASSSRIHSRQHRRMMQMLKTEGRHDFSDMTPVELALYYKEQERFNSYV
jgi:hypothetical protein